MKLSMLAAAAAAVLAAGATAMGSTASPGARSAVPATARATLVAHAAPTAQPIVGAKQGAWGNAHLIPGLAALAKDGSQVNQVACVAAGTCTAVGDYQGANKHWQAFVTDEKNGTWGAAHPIPGLATLSGGRDTTTDFVACAQGPNCAVIGFYVSASGHHQWFAANEKNGAWQTAIPLPGLAALSTGSGDDPSVNSLSCVPGSNCVAVGSYTTLTNFHHPFIAAEKNGTWQRTIQVPGISGLNANGDVEADAYAVSCVTPGVCALAGSYHDEINQTLPFTADEKGGTWGQPRALAGVDSTNTNGAQPTAMSCARAGECAVTGTYRAPDNSRQDVWVADEKGGTWGPFQVLPGLVGLNVNGDAEAVAISCRAPGFCSTGGTFSGPFLDPPGSKQAYVADERSGGWDIAQQVFGPTINPSNVTRLNSLSCGAAGDCALGGSAAGGVWTLIGNEIDSSWGNARRVPGIPVPSVPAAVTSVTCVSPGNCAAGGYFGDASQHLRAFVVDQSTVTSTALTLSAANIRSGHEQTEKLTVHVKARTSGTPSGTVTVKAGTATVCVIKLAGGNGTCTLKASQLRIGSYQLTAGYGGSQVYSASTSAKHPLTVTK
jgi:Big-like domain-containing protein